MHSCRSTFTSLTLLASLLLSSLWADEPSQPLQSERRDFFQQQVLPIFKQHCYECHSHKPGKVKGGLVLDSRSGWAKGGESGPAIVAGKPDLSLLIQAVRFDGLKMPPAGKLADDEIQVLEQWVADGAYDPRVPEAGEPSQVEFVASDHWAFQPLRKGSAPRVKNARWTQNSIDRFILARLEDAGITPVADADRYTWLRRVSFDLTGLPPTVSEIESFLADDSRSAYATVVDRLLASSAFGERWARHWLDLVGYADQVGTSNNVFAQFAWRYRDYVIDALNSDKPFDRFIREQVAGDLLQAESVEETAASITATGFLVLGDIEIVEADKQKLLVDIVDHQVRKISRAFLAMTVDCARCHDHKFDPISQRDYYALAGFFHSTSTVYKTERGVWSDVHKLAVPETAAQQEAREKRQQEHQQRMADLAEEKEQAQKRIKVIEGQLMFSELTKEHHDKLVAEKKTLTDRVAEIGRIVPHATFFAPTIPRVHGVQESENPGDMRITIRGNPRALGDQVPRGFLSVLGSQRAEIPNDESARIQLANWLTHPQNPLTARVTVNRIWQKLFGEGLVRTVDYFGLPGESPSHPELLDELASSFIKDRWSQKRLIRMLVLSRTYRLSSSSQQKAQELDPDNRLLWRMPRRRLDAESLRDAMIFASGSLKKSTGGPALPLEFLENVGGLNPTDVNPPSFRLARWRPEQELQRTIYLPVIRSGLQPGPAELRNVFDFPQPSDFSGKRAVTAVPTQALFLMNSPVVGKHAAALAQRLSESTDDQRARLKLLWLTLLSRPITEEETVDCLDFLAAAEEDAWTELCHALLASNDFLMRL